MDWYSTSDEGQASQGGKEVTKVELLRVMFALLYKDDDNMSQQTLERMQSLVEKRWI